MVMLPTKPIRPRRLSGRRSAETSWQPGSSLPTPIQKKRLAGFAFGELLANRGIISGAVLDGMIENRGIRGQSGHGQLIDVMLEGATIKQVASDVV